MYIKNKNVLELIQRMLGYLGWAAHDPVLAKNGLVREDVKKLSDFIKNHKETEIELFTSKVDKDLLEKITLYFQTEEIRNPGNLHTLTGFGTALLHELINAISENRDSMK